MSSYDRNKHILKIEVKYKKNKTIRFWYYKTLQAIDIDINDIITYSHGKIEATGNNIKSTDDFFNLDSRSGEVTLHNTVENNMKGYFTFDVTANDTGKAIFLTYN